MIDTKSIRFPPPIADEMVRAILEGRKTVTRLVVKPRYRDGEAGFRIVTNAHTGQYVRIEIFDEWEDETRWMCGPYCPGDILYVRETWRVQSAHRFEADVRIEFKAGGDMARIQFPGGGDQYHSRMRYDIFVHKWADDRWHPSIHMPREAARIFLRVTGVRVERLWDITEEQARAEGAIDSRHFIHGPDNEYETLHSAREHFVAIWDNTIRPGSRTLYGWAANPWVRVIEFERCERPGERTS